MRPDERFDLRRIEVAHGDHRHEIGPIPIRVELLQTVVRERPNDVRLSDGEALGIARVLEQDGQLHVQHAGACAEAHAPLFQDDAALFLDLGRIEGDGVGPILQDQQRPVDHVGIVGGNLQLVDGLIKAGVGVDVRAEAHARRLQKCDDLLLREVTRAVEAHVFHEVREAPLVVVFENRTRADDQPKRRAALRLLVGAHVVAQTVGERADGNPRIDRNDRGQRYVLRAGGDGALSGRHEAGRRRRDQRQQQQRGACAKSHNRFY